jgi:uncharacterized protein (TIGR02246 family)
MRSALMISAIAAIAFAASASAQKSEEHLRQQIEGLTAAYQDAENKEDAAAIPGLFAKDGEFVNAFSQPLVKSGPQAIQKYYEDAFKSLKNRHIEIKLDQLSPLGSDVALGVGNFQMTGDGQHGGVKVDGNWTTVYVNGAGTWKIRRLTVFTPPPPPK